MMNAALLAKYGDAPVKKKKEKPRTMGSGLRIVDGDTFAEARAKPDKSEDEESDEDAPIIVNLNNEEEDEERKRKEREEREKRLAKWNIVEAKAGAVKKEVKEEARGSTSPARPKNSGDLSPPRRRRHVSSSPPRDGAPADLSPPRRAKRHDSNSPPPPSSTKRDLSPPRKRRHDSSSPARGSAEKARDLSPPRRKRHDSGSPPRGGRPSQAADLSPPRRRHDSPAGARGGRDLSPPRKQKRTDSPRASSSSAQVKHEPGAKEKRPGYGLVTAEESKRLNEQMLRERAANRHLENDELTGRGAKTVFRRKETGKRFDPNDEKEKDTKERKGPAPPTEQQMEWGMGVVQKRQAENEEQAILDAVRARFERTEDDADRDKMLREQQHWDDPMRGMLEGDGPSSDPRGGQANKKLSKKERKEREKLLIEKAIRDRRTYKGSFQPNRFHIRPGYRWDGVDRSNGYERDLFQTKSKQAELKQGEFEDSVAHM